MKKIKYIFILLFCIFVLLYNTTLSKNKIEYDGEAIVISKSGLVLREKQGRTSQKMLTIPYESAVKLVAAHTGGRGSFETIYGIGSNWYKVNYKGKIGWVFGGFLKRKNPKNINLISVLQKKGELEVIKRLGNKLPIMFGEWNDRILFECDYIKDNNKFFCDCGRGFCSAEFIRVKQTTKGAEFIVEFHDCTKIGKADDGVGPCLESSIHRLKYIIDKKILTEVLNGRMMRFHVKGKTVWKKTKKHK